MRKLFASALALASLTLHAAEPRIAPLGLFVGDVSGNLVVVEGDEEIFDSITPTVEGDGPFVDLARMKAFEDSLQLRFWARGDKHEYLRSLKVTNRAIERQVFGYPKSGRKKDPIVPDRVSLAKISLLTISIYGARFEAALDGSGAFVRVPEGEPANGFLGPESYTEIVLNDKSIDRYRRAGFHEAADFGDYLSCIEGLSFPSQGLPLRD